jgi:RNA polymerase sigma factor (sigma-70 family)
MTEDEPDFRNLLAQIGQGSEDAARTFLERYGKYIQRVVRRRLDPKLRSKFDSDDFVQDVFASFFKNPPAPETFQPEAFLTFLANMARNKVADAARQQMGREKRSVNRENSLDGSARIQARALPGLDPTPSETAVANEKWQSLLQQNGPQQERILQLLRMGYTHEEIARVLELNAKRVQRLLQKLRAKDGA